jgi:hypothetical protein
MRICRTCHRVLKNLYVVCDSNFEIPDPCMKAAIPEEEIPDTLDEILSRKSSNPDLPWPPSKLSDHPAVSHPLSSQSPPSHDDPPFNVENKNDAPPENEHFPTERKTAPSPPPPRKGPLVRNHPADDSIVPPTETQSSSSSNSQPPPGGTERSLGDVLTRDDAPSEQRISIDAPIQPSSTAHLPSLTSLIKQSKGSLRSLKRITVRSPSRSTSSHRRSLSPPQDELPGEHCSADATAATSSRPMGRLPVYSPSKFIPYLKESTEDDSVEDISNAAVASAYQDDEDYIPSSIEQFSSPDEKRTERRARRLYRLQKPGGDENGENDGDETRNNGQSDSEDDDSEIRRNGEKLAALAALRKAKEKVKRIRKPLVLSECDELKETVEEMHIENGSPGVFMDNRATLLEEEEGNDQEGVDVFEEAGDEEEIARLENDFIDLTGGARHDEHFIDVSEDNLDPFLLRMEEEECTQDLLLEMEALHAARATEKEVAENGLALVSNPIFCGGICPHHDPIEGSKLSSTL